MTKKFYYCCKYIISENNLQYFFLEITVIGMLYLDILGIFIIAQIKNDHAQENQNFEQTSKLSLL
jgi:hypothetical protein